jgi:hypothetical protein
VKKLSVIGIVVSSTLVLTGCVAYPSILEISQPANVCDGSEIHLVLDNDRPAFDVDFTEQITLSVVDDNGIPVSDATLEKIEIEYRIGLFGENGLEEVVVDSFSERSPYHPSASPSASPLPTTQAFLDLLWDVSGPTPSPSARPDGETFSAIEMASSVITASVGELFSDSSSEMQLLVAIPGAFMAKCLDTQEYVAAVPMFPNTSVEDVSPVATEISTPESLLQLDFSRLFSSGNAYGQMSISIAPIRPNQFSTNEISQRWLNATSFNPEDFSDGITQSTYVQFDTDSSWPEDAIETVGTLEDGTYYGIITYVILTDSPGSDGPETVRFGSAHYDVVVSNGNYNFIFRYHERVSPPSFSPQVAGLGDKVSVSAKGFREISVTGSRLGRVQSANIGGRKASILSSYGSELKLRLPPLAAGSYDLNLVHSGGEIKNARNVTYLPAKRVSQLELGSSKTTATWLRRSNALLDRNSNILQVDCVVTVAEGSSAKALRRKAGSICESLAKANPEVRAVTRTVIGPNTKTGFVLKFWG